MKTLRKLWQLATLLLDVMPGMARATTTNNTTNTDQRLKQRKPGVRPALLLMLSMLFALLVTTPGVLAASGDFSIDFVAAAPESYNHLTGGGAYDDGTIGVDKDVVESLEGGDFSCGDIATYFAVVTVADTTQADTDAPQTIELDFSFLADTTGQSGVAIGNIVLVQVNYGTIEDLIAGENSVDDSIYDDGGSAATLTDEYLEGSLFHAGSELHGTVKLDDLERDETVVVRIDVKLFCDPGSNPTGNLQGALSGARLTFINDTDAVDPPEAIPGGGQTSPFKQIGDICFPELEIQKTVNTSDGTYPGVETLTIYAGETVKYCYVVTNPSSCAPLYNVKLVDDNSTPGDTGDDFTVPLSGLTDVDNDGTEDDLNASGTAYGNVTVTINRVGTVINNATATGNDSIVEPTTLIAFDDATVIANVALNPQYSIDKTITGADTAGDGTINNAGEIIDYQIVVANDGNVDLTNVSVTDPLLGTLTGPAESVTADGILEVGETWTYTGNYTVLQSDLNDNGGGDGDIDNTATVSSDELPDESDSEEQPIVQDLNYSIDKTITGADTAGDGTINNAGEIIDYQIVVANDGNVDLTNVSVTDPLLGTLTGPAESVTADGILEVGETWTYTGNYTVLQSDLNDNGGGDGDIDNTATVSSDELPDESDSEEQPIVQDLNYSIDKTITGADTAGDGTINNAGEIIDYQIVVANDGNVDLTNVSVTDPLLGTLTGPAESVTADGILEVGETWTYTGNYTVLQSDLNDNGGGDGDIDNTANVSSNELPDESDSEAQPIVQNPAIDVEKYVSLDNGTTWEDADDPTGPDMNGYTYDPQFKFVVTNTGNVDLANITLTDSDFDLSGCTVPPLAVGAWFECFVTDTWVVVQHTDTASVAVDFGGQTYSDTDDANYYYRAPSSP